MSGTDLYSALYPGIVMHRRLVPFGHRFSYRIAPLLIDLDELPVLDRRLWLFSHNRRNLFSFHDRDHGACDGSPVKEWVVAQLRHHGRLYAAGSIRLLCFPRMLNYSFNPLSIFFCYDNRGVLKTILYDVRNTFGDKHGYLIDVQSDRPAGAPILQRCAKLLHVSPFLPLDGAYRFRISEPGARLAILIRQSGPGGEQLIATQTGQRVTLTDRALARLFARLPLMTVKIIAAIHWQALLLWRKGATFHRRPVPPKDEITAS